MKITFLGTGTSSGVPFIGCKCEVCTSIHAKDTRLRSSIHIDYNDTSIVIDSGPDFRYQMLKNKIDNIDALLFTHSHKDHIAGMDDIKAYNYFLKKNIDIYCSDITLNELKREFYYIFADDKYPGVGSVNAHTFNNNPFYIKNDIEIIPIKVLHYKMEVYGFRIGDFTYITDANYIAPEELNKVLGSKILVINALRHEKHISHFTLNEAIDIANYIKAEKTYFTHISHQLGKHDDINATLPPNIELAYDGLEINI